MGVWKFKFWGLEFGVLRFKDWGFANLAFGVLPFGFDVVGLAGLVFLGGYEFGVQVYEF